MLRREIYALAALSGAVLVALGLAAGLADSLVTTTGAVLIVAIRLVALWRHWNAPVAQGVAD